MLRLLVYLVICFGFAAYVEFVRRACTAWFEEALRYDDSAVDLAEQHSRKMETAKV